MSHQITKGDTKVSHSQEEQSQTKGSILLILVLGVPSPADWERSHLCAPQKLETGVSRADPGHPDPSLVPSP